MNTVGDVRKFEGDVRSNKKIFGVGGDFKEQFRRRLQAVFRAICREQDLPFDEEVASTIPDETHLEGASQAYFDELRRWLSQFDEPKTDQPKHEEV